MRQLFILATAIISLSMSAASKSQATKNKEMKQDDVKKFAVAIAQIKHFYITDLSYNKLITNSLKGMVRGLDPHSDYLTEEELKQLNTDLKGEFAGIGISIIPEDGLIRVISAIDESPAEKAGIKGNDIIFKVNGKLVSSTGIDNALKNIKGKPGTKANISVFRPDTKKILNLEIARKIMKNYPVKSKIIGDNLLYIRIPMFNEKTLSEIKTAINKASFEGVIIDLRNNPGGLLSAATDISDLFLDAKRMTLHNKRILSIKGRVKEFNTTFTAHDGDIIQNRPVVILINHGSASASEIVAGALENHHRAIVVGTKSFGKGSVQTVIPSVDSALKITTALYYLPNNTAIQARGIEPDIYVSQLKIIPEEKNMNDIISEASNESHIKNETDSFDAKLNNKSISKLAAKDFQLYQAAKILETIILERK